jgi:hypothetical protein
MLLGMYRTLIGAVLCLTMMTACFAVPGKERLSTAEERALLTQANETAYATGTIKQPEYERARDIIARSEYEVINWQTLLSSAITGVLTYWAVNKKRGPTKKERDSEASLAVTKQIVQGVTKPVV